MRKFVILGAAIAPYLINAHEHHHDVVVVEQSPTVILVNPELTAEMEPPAEIVETIGASPGEGFVWIKGHWHWDGRWMWHSGHWDRKPHPEAEWVAGTWVPKHHHWVWVEGYWK